MAYHFAVKFHPGRVFPLTVFQSETLGTHCNCIVNQLFNLSAIPEIGEGYFSFQLLVAENVHTLIGSAFILQIVFCFFPRASSQAYVGIVSRFFSGV